jgi:hypothetical protein
MDRVEAAARDVAEPSDLADPGPHELTGGPQIVDGRPAHAACAHGLALALPPVVTARARQVLDA